MQGKYYMGFTVLVFVLVLTSLACATLQPAPTPTSTPEPTATIPPTPTNTPRPSPTPRPTWTPDLAATRHVEERIAEVQGYYEEGYLTTNQGTFAELDDFRHDWAYIDSYQVFSLPISVGDFFLSAHFKWNSALANSNAAGCGFIFGLQPNNDHYAVFLDRTKVYFRISNTELGYSSSVEPTHIMGKVKFDYPAEADFTLIVKGYRAYVLVNDAVVSEYQLLRGRPANGNLGLTVLSGTNRDYGTLCEMTNLRLWLPAE